MTLPTNLELHLLAGQSNMAGRGKVTEADKAPDPQIFVLNAAAEWACQGEPVHFDKPGAGVGLGFAFAKLAARQAAGKNVGLIPCAVGGSDISSWVPGAELYENAVRRGKIAARSGRLKAILWHQGEASCGNPEKAAAYADTLEKIVAGFRRDLNAPDAFFVAGELGEFLTTRSNGASPFAREVNAQIRSIPGRIPRAAVASSAGLTDGGDELHFDAGSLKEFGRRYFEALKQLKQPGV